MFAALERHPVITGYLGTAASLSASAVGCLQQVEFFMRLASLGLGVATGTLTLIITWRKAFPPKSNPPKSNQLEPSIPWPRK